VLRTNRVILSKSLARLGIRLMIAAIRVLTGLASRFEEGDAPTDLRKWFGTASSKMQGALRRREGPFQRAGNYEGTILVKSQNGANIFSLAGGVNRNRSR